MKNKMVVFLTFIIAFIAVIFSNASLVFAKDIEYPKTNEAVVYTSSGLKTALTSTDITKIYLGADVKVTQTDIVVNTKVKNQIVIDGINPYSTDKTKHTLEEYNKSVTSSSVTIRVTSKGILEKITVRNMNIIAHNKYGTICVLDGVKGITQEYQNVNYKGPQLMYNRGGYAVLDNCDITLRDDSTAANTGEVAEISGVTLRNNVKITKEPILDFDEIFWIASEASGKGYITVEPGANVKVINNSYKDTHPSGFVYSNSKYNFEIGEGATFDYKGYRIFWECQPVTNMIVGKNATFIIDVSGCPSTGSLNGWVDSHLLKVYGGDFTINENADVSLILRNNKKAKVTLDLCNAKFNLQNPKNLLIYNDGADAILHYTKNPLSLTVSSIGYWSNASTDPYNLGTPKYLWKNKAGVFTINATTQALNGKYSAFNVIGYDNSGDKLDATTFSNKGIKVVSLNGDKPVNNYTVTFDTNNGSAVNPETVDSGLTINKPADPTKANNSFMGWFKDNNTFNEPWNFATDVVTKDITLYAKWDAIGQTDFVVKFDADGGTPEPKDQIVKNGEKVTKPTDPTKNGYIFEAWAKTNNGTDFWDFDNDKVTGNTTLYGIFNKDEAEYTISFVAKGGSNIPLPQTVKSGEYGKTPKAPTKAGDCFSGWFAEPTFETRWIFSTNQVYSDITLYGKWCYNN